MNRMSAWAIRNPVPVATLFLFLSLAGALGFAKLRLNDMPDIDIASVTVTVMRPGATPSEMEQQITERIEDSVAGLGGVKHIRSTINEGVSTTDIEFAVGTPTDRAAEDVRAAVTSIRADLPADVLEPVVQRVDATGPAILTFVVDAPGMAPDILSRFVDDDVAKAALSVDGVARIERAGGVAEEIRVRLDPDRLAALGVTAAQISAALKAHNVDAPGGRAALAGAEQAIRLLGNAGDVAALARMRLGLGNGRSVALSELGTVERSWAEPRSRARLDGTEVIGFSVFRSAGSGEVAVARAVRARLAAFAAAHPDITIREVSSSTEDVLEGYDAAIEALVLGAALAIAVVWLFLRDWRATLISSLALPLSLLPTFAVMMLLGQSLNSITLLGIALVVGILVDDAIVEIENIVRHMRQSGKNAYDAAMEAADEIGLAVVATTLSIIVVFMPVGFMPGIAGQIFRAFAIAVCASVFFSLVVARILTPLLSAHLMKAHGARHDHAFWVPAYLSLLRLTLRWRWLTVLAGVAFFVLSASLALVLPTYFMPATDRGRTTVSVELAPGANLAATDAVVRRASAILRARPEVASVYAAIGTPISAAGLGDGDATGEVRKASLTVNLTPRHDRAFSQQAFEIALAPELAAIGGARVGFGGYGGDGVEVRLASDDAAALARAAAALTREMQGIPGFVNAASTASLARPELQIRLRPDKAAAMGLSTETVAETVSIATFGAAARDLPKFRLDGRLIPVRVMLEDAAMSDLSRIGGLEVQTSAGPVPLSSVAEIRLGAGPNEINRVDRRRSASVTAELAGLTTGQAEAIVAELPSIKALPPAITREAAGDAENMEELFGGFILAIGAGIVLLYFVVALLFNDVIQPITILTALPLALAGALAMMAMTGTALSMPALIGILMLMGLAAKNSILVVEYAIVARRERGLAREEALIEAAGKRARPIVMTTVAMGAGMLPLALGIGADAEFRASMAIAVIGGLLSSTALSLIYVPAVYTIMDDLSRRLRQTFATTAEARPCA
ncbi:efflux RND transporter permease subunit [Acuticoccus kandeliae]|uniref:efflux RND transporter permease subunit n=1 Tax=Acuticoccus kandeliae TaxID=2073160 RepID=UPI000D3EB5B4|nr:efflux RND transporter permease subunit [Acuticoccus kandeliae]